MKSRPPFDTVVPGAAAVCLALLLSAYSLPSHSQAVEPGYDYGGQPVQEADIEYGIMRYSTTPRTDPIANLKTAGPSGLQFHPQRGYLDSLLQALGISPASQVLVFSRTSLNVTDISPRTPRAIYYNDQTYVAWIPDANAIEIASMDPGLGQVFYTLKQDPQTAPRFEQQTGQCLRCHDSYSMTGGGVPRFILGSGYTGVNGHLVSHEGWILTSTATPLRNRWGGWYVTGRHGKQIHLGNFAVTDPADLNRLDSLRIGNLENLESRIDTSLYLTPYSDIVALLVIEHQVEVQNLITRVNYDVRTALQNNPELVDAPGLHINSVVAPVRQLIRTMTEPLVRAMLMTDETPLTDTVSGSSGFREWFEARGPDDDQNRSLRDFDLNTRLFRYPLSYLIYSGAFNTLPLLAKQQVYLRIGEILGSEQIPEGYERLIDTARQDALSIIRATLPEFTRLTENRS